MVSEQVDSRGSMFIISSADYGLTEIQHKEEFKYSNLLRKCTESSSLRHGRAIHGRFLKTYIHSSLYLHNFLVNMYVKCGDLENGLRLFDEMLQRNVVSWTAVIAGLIQHGRPLVALSLFSRMYNSGTKPNGFTFVSVLQACSFSSSLIPAYQVYGLILKFGLESNVYLVNVFLTAQLRHNEFVEALDVFESCSNKDIVSWNAMIGGYLQCSYSNVPEFWCPGGYELVCADCVWFLDVNDVNALAAMSSIAELKSFNRGKEVHTHVIRNGLDYQVSVFNSLIDMYCKCGGLVSARKVFDLVANKTVISWSSIIKGFVSHEQFCDASSIFWEMKLEGYKIDFITVINILPAFASTGALEQVKYLYGYSTKCGLTSFPSVNTAFLASYAKCGCIEMAQKLFEEEEFINKDVIAWNSMIGAYSKHGNWLQCFKMYTQLKLTNLKPDQVTFLSILTACVNSGSVNEGWECFKEMTERYGCQPKEEHYACMVDLLGRAGRVKEALELIKSMPFKPDARVWGPLLSACKLHPDMKVAELAAERLVTMEPKNAGNYILLSNIYAAAGKWDEVARMRVILRDRGLKKTPGCSWLDINGKVHEFRVADQSHPQSDDIYTILRILQLETKQIMKKESSGSCCCDNS